MECKYIVNNESHTYQELVDSITDGELIDFHSILFSRQETTYQKVRTLKKEYDFERWTAENYNSINIEPSIKTGKDLSIQQFIDSHYFVIDGKAPMFKMSFDDYLKYKQSELVDQRTMTEEQALEHITNMKDKWEIIARDAFDLHKLVVSQNKTISSETSPDYIALAQACEGTAFEHIPSSIINLSRDIIRQIFLKNGPDKVGSDSNVRLLKNINLAAELKGLDFDIIGHIDYMLIKDNGDIEIFNIKSSIENYNNWDSVKKEKYRYQMALLKKILEYNGIYAKDIRLNIIPVKMTYDSEFKQIVSVEAESVKPIDFKDTEYILKKYDQAAAHFITSSVNLDAVEDESLIKLSIQLQKIFPGSNIQATGIEETAKSWLDRNWKQLNPEPIDGGGWKVTIPGDKKPIEISDPQYGSQNKELVDIIQDRLDDISHNPENIHSVNRVIKDIRNAYKRQGFYRASGHYGAYLSEVLSKYFVHPLVQDGKIDYEWKLLNNDLLTEAGILVFVNSLGQVDVITLTTYDVKQQHKFNKRDHLLGSYLPEVNDFNFTLTSTYGNIEAIRTMTILNEILPSLAGNFRLGELKILGISHQFRGKSGLLFDLQQLSKQFDTVVKVVNTNANAEIENNFRKLNVKYVDPVDILVQNWQEIVNGPSNSEGMTDIKSLDEFMTEKHLVDGTTIDGLVNIQTTEAKLEKLEQLLDKLRSMAIERGIRLNDPKYLLQLSKQSEGINSIIAKLYIFTTRALNTYYGDLSLENEDFSKFEEYVIKTSSSKNSNVRRVAYMFQKSVDSIANEMLQQYAPIRKIFMDFYEKAGYSKTQNAVIGNQASMYLNLFDTDLNGNRIMQFKNPYSMTSDLKDYERDFLKSILFEFYKVRCKVCGIKPVITGINDPKLIDNMPSKYLNVPLERASSATRKSQPRKNWEQRKKSLVRMVTRPQEFFEELQGLVGTDELVQREEDIMSLQAYNPFTNSEKSDNVRNSYILDKGVDYFEYNIENLFIDFLEKQIQSEEFNRLLLRAKGVELDLVLRGEIEQDDKAFNKSIKVIEDFLKLNVFNKSIMEESSQVLEAFMMPLRRAVSSLYVAGNIKGAIRDIEQGLLENITNAVLQFHTTINLNDVAFGYKEVIAEGVNNLMVATKLNQFNIKYRLSNLDVARISEGQKTGRGGILNAENWAYATLRGPDYLNRMVLFVAQMKHDGCYDAYSLDSDGRLVYDWRKDKRFALYAANDKSNIEEYNKQKSLYYSLIRAFNIENANKSNYKQLTFSDDLPDAYTAQEIQSFKLFSDNIYGSYNKSTKSKYEHIAIGRNFAFFSTWMNGMVDVYMKKTQVSSIETKLQQEMDYNGNLLFFEEDGTLTTVNTGVPVLKGVPIMVQGVFATLKDIYNTFTACGMDEKGQWSALKGFKAVKTDIWSNDIAKRNVLRLCRDALVGGLLAMLFKFYLNNKYKNYKQNADGEKIFANAFVEILFSASSSCFDTFLGPFAMLNYIGNQTNPATFKISSKIYHDVFSFVFGDKTFGQIAMNSWALPRTFQDTYKLWVRDNLGNE